MSLRFTLFVFSISIALAQAPPPQASSTSQASPLPLSGRAGQSGSANTISTPVPGLTSSVNTLNTFSTDSGALSGKRARRHEASGRQVVASRRDFSRSRTEPGSGRAYPSHSPGSRAIPRSARVASSQFECGAARKRPTDQSAGPRRAVRTRLFRGSPFRRS